MIPTNNNNNTGCNPISSNCVIWQGPDIDCGSNFKICNGDTVSDVVANLAAELTRNGGSPATVSFDIAVLNEIRQQMNTLLHNKRHVIFLQHYAS